MITAQLRAQLGPPEEVARIFDTFERFQREYHTQDPEAPRTLALLERYVRAAQVARHHRLIQKERAA